MKFKHFKITAWQEINKGILVPLKQINSNSNTKINQNQTQRPVYLDQATSLLSKPIRIIKKPKNANGIPPNRL
jgi:hypothetical protein